MAKFNDIADMPFVAYRHWSDIVNNNAVEASYMMARRVGKKQAAFEKREVKASRLPPEPLLSPRSEKRRQEEELSKEHEHALDNARELASEAIKSATSTAEGSNTFKELLNLAKDSASDGGDRALARVFEQALQAFRNGPASTATLPAKRLICDYLDIDGGEEMEEMKRKEEEAKYRKLRITVTLSGTAVKNEPFGAPSTSLKAAPPPRINGGSTPRDARNAARRSLDTTMGMEAAKISSSSSSSSSSTVSSSTASSTSRNGSNGADSEYTKVCLVPVESRIGSVEAFGSNSHSTRGLRNYAVHFREDESLGWSHGPFRRYIGVRLRLAGKAVDEPNDLQSSSSSSSKGRNKKSHKQLPAPLKATLVTTDDNIPISNAAAYAKHALKKQLSGDDTIVVGDAVMVNGLSLTGGWMEAIIERRARKVRGRGERRKRRRRRKRRTRWRKR